MAKRRGMDTGRGSGYRNIIGKDPRVHSDSAKSMKQPQITSDISSFVARMEQAKQKKPAPEPIKAGFDAKLLPAMKQEPEFKEIKASAEDPDVKPSGFMSAVGKAEAFASKYASKGWTKGKEYLKEKQKVAETKRIAELKDIKHPDEAKLEAAQDKIASLEKQIELNEDPQREDKLFGELDVAKAEKDMAEKALKDIDLTALSEEQLKTLAIRHSGDTNFFSTGSKNKYEKELLRRITARRQLDADIEEEQKKPLKKPESAFGDFFK